jgi:hypothetical protein
MNVGIYGGGFKPFTTGHYGKLLYSCGDVGNCEPNDVVFLFYGIAERKKGSAYFYTREMAQQIFQIMRVAIERELGSQVEVHVVEAKPTPLAMIFAAVGDAAGVAHPPIFSFDSWGIDPGSIRKITVYGENESLQDFTRHIGTAKEEKYYGDLIAQGKLRFDPGYSEDPARSEPDEDVINKFLSMHPDMTRDEAIARTRVRGSDVRAAILTRDPDAINRFLPSFLNDDERAAVIDILMQGIESDPQITEALLRNMIRGFLVS